MTLKCLECGFIAKNNSGLSSHIRSKHKLEVIEYSKKHNYKTEGIESDYFKIFHDKNLIRFSNNRTLECEICGLMVANNSSYLESHLKRTHGITDYGEYYKTHYKNKDNIDFDTFDDKCGLCNKRSIRFKEIFEVNHEEKTFYLKDKIIYACNHEECKNATSLKILGTKYDKKTYEFIGSRAEYLAAVHKTTVEYVSKNMKHGERDDSKPHRTNLHDYCLRYGVEKGTELYNERCDKISKSQKIEYYIEKHGEILGRMYFNEKLESCKLNTLGTTKSKIQKCFGENIVDRITTDYIEEYPFDNTNLQRRTDFYLNEYNTHIEFFGDYWHASRKIFSSGDIHKTLKIPVNDIWKRDNNRIRELTSSGANVIIIWESTYNEYKQSNSLDNLIKLIRNILNGGYKSQYFSL